METDNKGIEYELELKIRMFKKYLRALVKRCKKQNFKKILYLTLNKPPVDYIQSFKRQYPDKDFCVLTPVIGTPDGLEKTSISFDFFLQNRVQHATLYKYPKTRDNITVYGIYSTAFSESKDISRLQNLAPFIKSARICAQSLKPDIIHAENIPFFLGAEFEGKISNSIKVFQTIKDFSAIVSNKYESFWAAINLVDRKGMKKLCRDKIIKKCIASLFNLHNTKKFYQMRECLEFIYKNYLKFRKFVDKCEDIDENILFNRMNARILKLFPQMAYEDDLFYNPMYFSIKKSDSWAVTSKTYYEEIFNAPELSGKMFKRLEKTKSKSAYISYGYEPKEESIYQPFTPENFREYRHRNKRALLREFSKDRIVTKFIDRTLFKDEEFAIRGYLDSFYESPLILGTFTSEVFQQGVDIAFNSILKLFELNKNIQVIISIAGGLESSYIKSWVEFLESNTALNGRWVFIDGKINLARFCASSDMILLPKRANVTSDVHYVAMKYGCITIASRSGIYNDTISDIFDDITYGCGFKTKTSLLVNEDATEIYLAALSKALNLYLKNPSSWNLLIKNAMQYDSRWSFEIIEKYNEIYESL